MAQNGLPPGYRFSPTDEELVGYYLKNRACGKDFHQGVIAEVDIYKFEPWELPEKSVLPSLDPVWYFFNAQDKRHSHTARINRTTSKGYWKATGKDRKIGSVGMKKTLIYYEGRAPSGKRTDWIMHEYKLDEEIEKKSKVPSPIALCRIRRKGGLGPRNGEQYGASIYYENNEGEEDVEEHVDEKPSMPLDSKYEVSALPNQIKIPYDQGEVVSHEFPTEGCASNELSRLGGPETNSERDLQEFLDLFFATDTEVTSVPVFSHPGVDKSLAGHQPFACGTNADGYSLVDLESLLEADDDDIVEDILHPSFSEEKMIEEILHYADGGSSHDSNIEPNGRVVPQPPAFSDSTLAYIDADNVVVSECPGDFIELDDMNSPLDGFVMPSSQGRYYTLQEDQDPFFVLRNEVEYSGGSSDLLYTQGSAPRRARLQIAPSSVNKMHAKVQEQINVHPKVQYGGNSSHKIVQIVGGNSNQNITYLSSGSNSDAEEIPSVGKSLPKTFVSKHISHCMVVKCEEVPPQVFATTSDEELSLNDCKRDTALFRAQNSSSVVQESRPDCRVGLASRSLLIPEHLNKYGHMQHAGVDFEAGLGQTGVSMAESSYAVTASSHCSSVAGELASKMKLLTLSRGLEQLDSTLSTTFNDKVFALGKPVAQLVPSTNPYRSLRRGAMASLFQLVIAVVFLFFLFLGIHMLTKYVLSAAVRT